MHHSTRKSEPAPDTPRATAAGTALEHQQTGSPQSTRPHPELEFKLSKSKKVKTKPITNWPHHTPLQPTNAAPSAPPDSTPRISTNTILTGANIFIVGLSAKNRTRFLFSTSSMFEILMSVARVFLFKVRFFQKTNVGKGFFF